MPDHSLVLVSSSPAHAVAQLKTAQTAGPTSTCEERRDTSCPPPAEKRLRHHEPCSTALTVELGIDVCVADARGKSVTTWERGVSAINSGEAADAAPSERMELLDDILATWAAFEPRLRTLRNTASSRMPVWDAMLRDAVESTSMTDEAIEQEQANLAEQKYGSEATHFCVLPPSIAKLLPVSTHSEEEASFAEMLQRACDDLSAVKGRLLALIVAAKERGERESLRELGPRLSAFSKEIKAVSSLDSKVSKRMTLASRHITRYRARQVLREVNPLLLRDVEANLVGYTKILDFYRLSDAARYSFGRQLSGPQHFTDIRRNVAVLEVWDESGARVFNGYAVSGTDGPGVNPVDAHRTLFEAQEAEDGLGETYPRDQDAEFKLCSAFCGPLLMSTPPVHGDVATSEERLATDAEPGQGSCGPRGRTEARSCAGWRAVLFSKKPLCTSCHHVVYKQFLARVPGLSLQVVVDEADATGGQSAAPAASAADNNAQSPIAPEALIGPAHAAAATYQKAPRAVGGAPR